MTKMFVFEFAELASGKAEKKLAQVFSRAGSNVVQSSVGPMKRTSGISFKDVSLTFADGQGVTLSVKQSGDIYMVKLNGKVLPIKNQDQHAKAIAEMVKAMDAGRSKFQAVLAKTKAALPPGLKSAAPKIEAVLKQKDAELDSAIAEARGKVEELRKELGDGAALDSVADDERPNGDGITGDEPALDGAVAATRKCPECGGAIVMSERHIGGNSKCENGHEFKSANAVLDETGATEEDESAGEVSEDQASLFEDEKV